MENLAGNLVLTTEFEARSQNSALRNLFCSSYLDQSIMRTKHVISAFFNGFF